MPAACGRKRSRSQIEKLRSCQKRPVQPRTHGYENCSVLQQRCCLKSARRREVAGKGKHLRGRVITLRRSGPSSASTTVLKLTGRIQSGNPEELSAQIGSCATQVGLDLEGVTLVDADVIRFLGASEKEQITVLRCSLYIREWIRRESEESSRE